MMLNLSGLKMPTYPTEELRRIASLKPGREP